MTPCDSCGTTKNVTYHPRVNLALCKRCTDILCVILGVMEEEGPIEAEKVKVAVRFYQVHFKEA